MIDITLRMEANHIIPVMNQSIFVKDAKIKKYA